MNADANEKVALLERNKVSAVVDVMDGERVVTIDLMDVIRQLRAAQKAGQS